MPLAVGQPFCASISSFIRMGHLFHRGIVKTK